MSSRHHRGGGSHQTATTPAPSNPTYSSLAALRDKLRSTKVTERRAASKELLEKLHDSSTLRKLEREAGRGFDNAVLRAARESRGGRGGGVEATLPWDRVCILYRSLMDAALLASRTVVSGVAKVSDSSTSTIRSKKRSHANQTGFTMKKLKYTADDVLFPYKVFLRMDMDQSLECNDGGYGGSGTSWERDWKTRPRYGHHLDISCLSSSSSSSSAGNGNTTSYQGRRPFNATHYTPRSYTDKDRGSRLTPKEIIACVDYCIDCLNDDDCCNQLGCEPTLLQWLVHICSRPEYLAVLPHQNQLSHVLHELSTRLNRAFVDGKGEEKGILGTTRNASSGRRRVALPQESLLACAKCLGALVYNTSTRLGVGMHLYMRPVIELVAVWAENAWQMQSEGEFASSSETLMTQQLQLQQSQHLSSQARNPHSKMVEEGQINPSSHRRKLRTEADILSLMPHLYSSVTHLLAVHPKHSVPILSDHGHALLRLARRNYARPTTNLQTRDALTEYISAHLLVAETSGRLCGLPEGDLGPLVPKENYEENEDEEEDDGDELAKKKKRKKRKGATLDAKSIAKLLEMIRNEKVWESLFSPAASGGHQDAKKKKARRSLSGRKHGRSGGSGGISLAEGGATWTPLSRRQRRHLELMARLIRISQRFYLAEAEDKGNGTANSLESLIEYAEERMQSSGIEQGEIDILPKDKNGSAQQSANGLSSEVDERHLAAPSALVCSPWIRMVCRHLYKINPKLDKLVSASTATSFSQDSTRNVQFSTQLNQNASSDELLAGNDANGVASHERILLESCPMLRALAIDESALRSESNPAAAAMTPGTLSASLTALTPTKTSNNADMLDSIRPTAIATLQFLCACAESFPRGECWSSSTRHYWSTILDKSSYPEGTSAKVLERHGSSPADAAAVVYLLGTTLECHGGSAGEDDIQLWTLVTLLKMTESSAIICSREGLAEDAASFGSSSSLGALRVAWQLIWKILFRYDLRYSAYTSGAFGNNVGELVVQLLTQIIRWGCVDRKCLFVCRPPSSAMTSSAERHGRASTSPSTGSTENPFVHGEQGQLWKLPVFEQDASCLLSCAPFELITSVVQFTSFSDSEGVSALATASASSMQMANATRDRRYFISFCLRFIELSMEDTTESIVRRSFLPYAATCLASLISDGGITSNVVPSTFELDGLSRFCVTEDTEPITRGVYYDPDSLEVGASISINGFYTALWPDSIIAPMGCDTDSIHLKDLDRGGLALRIAQGRGAFLNQHPNANYEREQLRCFIMNNNDRSSPSNGITDGVSSAAQRISPLGSMVYEKIKSCFDELIFQLKYEDNGNEASDDEEKDNASQEWNNKSLALPQLTSCLSLILTVLLAKHSTAEDISRNVVEIYADTFAVAFDLLVEHLPSMKGVPTDVVAVFSHLHGIVRVLTFTAAFGGGGIAIPQLFGSQAKSLFALGKSLLKKHRNETCTSGFALSMSGARSGHDFDSDSDDNDRFVASRAQQTQQSQTRISHFSDDSDGLMDDNEDEEKRDDRSRRQRALPPPKRRRIGNNGSNTLRSVRKISSRDKMHPITDSIGSRGACACASFMIVLQPSFKCVELIASHLVWPEDSNFQVGYGTVCKTPDPFEALVCAMLFCQKTVLLRRDRLDLQSAGQGKDEDEDQESALILAIEVILQTRRRYSPSSRHFMCGLGLLAGIVNVGDNSECCGPIGVDESKMVLEALCPEGVGKESEDFHLLRQWKRILKYRSSYRVQQIHAAILSFYRAQKNLRAEIEAPFGSYFMYSSFKQIDENVRSQACDALGAAIGIFPDQDSLVSDVLLNLLPRLDNDRKFAKWADNSLVDLKLRDELKDLEDTSLSDAENSIKYDSIDCIGLIAGSASDAALGREMIWKLIDLAVKNPTMLLPCYRACKRAGFLLGFKQLSDMFDAMMPHLLVNWLESQRSLKDFPLFLMSPSTFEQACHHLPNEILSMLMLGGGWSDDFFCLDEMEGSEAHSLNERVLRSFVESVAKFLIPNILLSASDGGPANDGDDERIDTTKYLTECVLILTGVDSDDNVAKVLCNHISDLYGFVAVLAENGDATEECENAFKLLKRCVSSVHIERTGAKSAFLVLRHILLLHRKGISVVGLDNIELSSTSFIEGMKYVSKQLKAPSSNRIQGSFLEQLGSSMTESIVLVNYWLSSSLTARQRDNSWGTMSLLWDILEENVQNGKIEPSELGFCLHSFIGIILDPENNDICPLVLDSLKSILGVLFSSMTKVTLVDGTIAVLHKLSLALLQIHQRAFQKLYISCDDTLCCIEYEQKSSQGLLSAFEDAKNSWDCLGEAPWAESRERDEVLKSLIVTKAEWEEKVSSGTMLGAYECLEIIANSGKMQLEDILGAEDTVLQSDQKEEIFRRVNKKYSMLSFFNSIHQKSTTDNGTILDVECKHFIHIMNEHPISDEFDSSTSYSSHGVLARLLALRRLEMALLAQHNNVNDCVKSNRDIYLLLLSICQSGDPEESRVISSRCLGELNFAQLSTHEQDSTGLGEVKEYLNDPILSIKRTILAMLGQYLLSECAVTSLVAMKTAKALLVTPAGKECWQSLDGDIKGLLSPFNTVDEGKLRKEAVRVSDSCLDRLKSISIGGSPESDSWCWCDGLWTCFDDDDNSCDLWIREITSSIISCCFCKGSKIGKGDQDFFQICQGLCAMEASFAASIFPALIFHLLDSEATDQCKEDSGVRDVVMSNIAIGSPTSGMNHVISHCFSHILSLNSNFSVASKAITVILNTLELLRAITEHRFLTSPEHAKNKSIAAQKQKSSSSKRRRSRNASDSADTSAFANSPKWRGFPYGVVLRVSGLEVAKACFKVKRYYSALYYAEMSMQNLIGTGTFFEDVANYSAVKYCGITVCDISGFGIQNEESQEDKTALEKALMAQDIIGCCLSELHAKDELQGVLSQGSALNLKQNITSLNTLEGCRRDQTFSTLLDLDNGFQTVAKTEIASNSFDASRGFSTIASCLEDLGLNHIKQNYLAGVENHLGKDQSSNSDRLYLREKWFEDSLNQTLQWDDSILPKTNDGETPTLTYDTVKQTAEMAHDAHLPSASQPMANFYQSVHGALRSFARNDGLGLNHILQARKSVLRDMRRLAGSEAQSTGMVAPLTKLNMLSQLELVAKTLEGTSSLTFLMKRWGCLDNPGAEKLESLLLNNDTNFDMKEQVTIDGTVFRFIRTEFSVKEVALKILTNKFPSSQEGIGHATANHIYKSCKAYRKLGHPDAAKVSLSSLRSLMQVFQRAGISDHSSSRLPLMLRLEDAKIMTSQNDLSGAIMHCKMIVNHLSNTTNESSDIERDQICAESLLLGGLWMAQQNVDAAESILSSFFEDAAKLAMQIHHKSPSHSSVQRASVANFKLGEFAANLYNSVEARVSSEAWKRRNIVAKERKKELEVVKAQIIKLQKKTKGSNEDPSLNARIIHATLSKEVDMDERELKSVQESLQRYLQLAVESYCSALKLCPTSISSNVAKHVFQLVSLWFKNCQQKETKDIVNDQLKSNLSQIPSYRFVPLTYQLFSRIDEVQENGQSGFQDTLREIVLKICSEHPYHGIVQLLALSNGKRVGEGVNGRHANEYLKNVGSSKVDAVNDIIQELHKVAPEYISALIDSYQTLMNSYMNLAEFDTSNIQKRATKGFSFKQYKLDLDSCLSGGRRGKRTTATANMPAIITKPPPIRPDAQYGNGADDPIGTERVVSFEPTFDLTLTGLHRPKIVKCIGSKGNRFKQLVKGEDDLRQDAIMEQVFGTVNDLLRHEDLSGNEFIAKSMATRRLKLITYGITPMSPASGVLEWVDNTMCFGDFLTDRGKKIGAHSKYFPGEWGSSDVREFYRSAGEAPNATPESKRKAFEKICENFSPAFRFFFLEYFSSSMEAWHTARTLYTRSCAVNSIVGHILGIGDRHTSNILVHTKTGEVVHIDFGIVFEQGKTLTTPELVPFRLTRDIIDGMGPSGTDGVFSKAAEATMCVLRNNADTLLTILSAVVSDPLYKWSLSPMTANQHQRNADDPRNGQSHACMQSTSDENRNDAADRAITKIHEKLEGYEEGTSGEHKTVAGQVKLLINEARDPGNLSVMFAGWAPWM